MGVLYSQFTSSNDSIVTGLINGGSAKKMVEKNSSNSGTVSFYTGEDFTKRSSACTLISIMLLGQIGLSKTYKNRAMDGRFDFVISLGNNEGTTKPEPRSIDGLLGPAVDEIDWSAMSPQWKDATLINTSIFGSSSVLCSLSITLVNLDSGIAGRALNFHMNNFRVAFEYNSASYIYFKSEGKVLNSSTTFYSGGSIPSYSGSMERTGYTFDGWKSSRDGKHYKPGDTLPAADDYDTIYDAVWIENTYTLNFDPNGGSGGMDSQVLYYESSIVNTPTEAFANPTNTIYYNSNGATQNFKTESVLTKTFRNWIDEKGKTFNVGDSINKERTGITGDNEMTLYAQWNDVGEILEKPFRQYHTFIGWKDEDNPNTIYQEGYNLILSEGNKRLEAQWEKTQPRIFIQEQDTSTNLQRIPFVYLKNKKVKKIFIYTPEDGLKEI